MPNIIAMLHYSLFLTTFHAALCSPLLDPESVVVKSIVPEDNDQMSNNKVNFAPMSKRDPEVAAPLILSKREKKAYFSRYPAAVMGGPWRRAPPLPMFEQECVQYMKLHFKNHVFKCCFS